jgi:ferredoxin--NADP+ reductase
MTDSTAKGHAHEVELPGVKMHIYRPNEPVTVRIHRTEVCTGRKAAGIVRHVEFDISGTDLVGNCVPGQSVGVLPPGTDERSRPHKVRLYSLASPTRGEVNAEGVRVPHLISTTVKRTIDEHWETHRLFLGVASNFLCDLPVGGELKMSGPNGKRFVLPARPHEHDYVFFATGTGIAPFRGMLIDLLEAGVPCRIALVMGAPYASDLLYHDFFLRMQAEHPGFTYLTAISREKQADGHDPLYVQDRLRTDHERLAPLLLTDRTLIYVCGVAGMELGIFQELARRLTGDALEQYLQVDKVALGDIRGWTKAMLHKEITATRRVFLEVYA